MKVSQGVAGELSTALPRGFDLLNVAHMTASSSLPTTHILFRVLPSKKALSYSVIFSVYCIWRATNVGTSSKVLSVLLLMLSYVLVLGILVTLTAALQVQKAREPTEQLQAAPTSTTNDTFPPLLFPSRTTHRRLFPTLHSFSYSYLLVGVPITKSSHHYGSLLSTHAASLSPSTWFSVHSKDYLQRGSSFSRVSLREKLDVYLSSRGVDPAIFPCVYLVTAPSFLGFSFNPVSFWYLYDANNQPRAMILEVNNTFDERRMYLLYREEISPEGNTSNFVTYDHKAQRFTFTWKKDFHVSPFNDRDGSYSVSAVDIARTKVVDVTIVLRNGEEKPKIIARVYSTLPSQSRGKHEAIAQGISPTSLTSWAKFFFILHHGFVGFLTNPRILLEARHLWRKSLTVFYRPEPLASTIPRTETAEEAAIECVFRHFLMHLARKLNVYVQYVPAAGPDRGKTVYISATADDFKTNRLEEPPGCVRVEVLTPAFYGEFVRTRDVWEVFERVGFVGTSEEKGRMVRVTTRLCSPGDGPTSIVGSVWKNGDEEMKIMLRDVPRSTNTQRAKMWKDLEHVSCCRLQYWSSLSKLMHAYGSFGAWGQVWVFARGDGDVWCESLGAWRCGMSEEAGKLSYFDCALAAIKIRMADRVALGSMAFLNLQLEVLRVLILCFLTGQIMSKVSGGKLV